MANEELRTSADLLELATSGPYPGGFVAPDWLRQPDQYNGEPDKYKGTLDPVVVWEPDGSCKFSVQVEPPFGDDKAYLEQHQGAWLYPAYLYSVLDGSVTFRVERALTPEQVPTAAWLATAGLNQIVRARAGKGSLAASS